MAKWTQFDVSSATTGGKGLQGTFDLEAGEGYFEQDLTNFLKNAELDRHEQEQKGIRKDGYRKFATIPDGVAMKVMEDHHLDLHDPAFMSDPNNLKLLKKVIVSEYPYLVVNK